MNVSLPSMLKLLERIVEINNTGVTGRILPPNTDFEHARVWPTYFRLRFLNHDRHTYIPTDIPREISIEHPSVGLASLAQLQKQNEWSAMCDVHGAVNREGGGTLGFSP